MKIKSSISVSSFIGKRPSMQDAHVYIERLGDHNYSFLGIYDGHGGTIFAELATQRLHLLVDTYLNSGIETPEAIRAAFTDMDNEICQLDMKGGTTASVMLIKDDFLLLAHVGDTRVVLQQKNRIVPLTKDHRHSDLEEAQRYQSSSWYQEKSRLVSQGKLKGFYLLAVTRSLGDCFFEDAVSAVPEISEIKLEGNERIIIGTDGLWEVMSNEEAFDIYADCSPKEASDLLVEQALLKGGSDNLTVATIHFTQEAPHY